MTFATHSSVSIPAIKSTVSQLVSKQSNKYMKCVAPWFTTSQFIIKILEMVFSVVMILLLFLWESEGVKITSLHQEEYNYRNKVFYFVGVACLTILYAVTMTTLGFTGVKIPPKALTFFAGVCFLCLLLATPIMSATLDTLEHSVYARQIQLNLLMLKLALLFGFFLLMSFLIDILLGFLALQRSDGSHVFKSELKHSRSVLAAAKISARQSKLRMQ